MVFLLIGLSEHRPLLLGQGLPLRWLALLFGLLAWHAGAGERVIYPRHSEGRNPNPTSSSCRNWRWPGAAATTAWSPARSPCRSPVRNCAWSRTIRACR
ncbi:hypothetical protein P4114_28025 [Pseudomonas aeruginosa]|nr:hypothetical protein [Pseudomonas aeruginosa]